MPAFSYLRPTDAAGASAALRQAGRVALGGGTDLLAVVKEGLVTPVEVVDLRRLPEAGVIRVSADGGLHLGAGARLAAIASHPEVTARFAALAEACGAVGSPALREMGTLGGNLAQRPRCWYWRRQVPCLKSGGTDCPALAGEHRYHAIVADGTCRVVHPSDPAVALTALEATVIVQGPSGTRTMPIAALYDTRTEADTGETTLAPGEFIAAVEVPATSAGGTQQYHKLMQRGAWDFALVSLAAVKRHDGDVRLVLGGVAARPWRIGSSIEEDVASGGLDDDSISALAERALYDATPLPGNAYKVTMAQALLRRAMRALGGA